MNRTLSSLGFAVLVVANAALPAGAQTPPAAPSPSPSPSAAPASPSAAATPSPYRYVPPVGWTKTTSLVPSFGPATDVATWKSPTVVGENINLLVQPVPAVAPAVFAAQQKAVLEKIVGDANVVTFAPVKTCGGSEDAYFVDSKFPIGAFVARVEEMEVIGPKSAYTVVYARRDGAPEDAAARASLSTLCSP